MDMSKEFENIVQWAADNYMIVNTTKSKEIVFHRPSARHSLLYYTYHPHWNRTSVVCC